MGSYEIAVVLGVLGTGFFLAYISDKFGVATFWGTIFKSFLIFSAFAMTLSVPTIEYYFVLANNGTNYTSIANNPQLFISTSLETHMFIYQWVFIFTIVLFICYIIWFMAMLATGKRPGENTEQEEDE